MDSTWPALRLAGHQSSLPLGLMSAPSFRGARHDRQSALPVEAANPSCYFDKFAYI